MDCLGPLPATFSPRDAAERVYLRRLLLGDVHHDVALAIADRYPMPLDQWLLACGARLALDAWQSQPWTADLLERLSGCPSASWRSVLLAVDAGVTGSAWTLSHALDDPSRRKLAALGDVHLLAIAAAGLADEIEPPGLDPSIAALIGQVQVCRRALGDVPRPWSDDFGDQPPVSDQAAAALRALPPLLDAAGIQVAGEPEIDRVLSSRIDEDDADWAIHALDEIAARLADRFEPHLVGALAAHLRDEWSREWREWAHVLVRGVSATG